MCVRCSFIINGCDELSTWANLKSPLSALFAVIQCAVIFQPNECKAIWTCNLLMCKVNLVWNVVGVSDRGGCATFRFACIKNCMLFRNIYWVIKNNNSVWIEIHVAGLCECWKAMRMIKTNRLRSYNEIVSSEINQMCSCSNTEMNTDVRTP